MLNSSRIKTLARISLAVLFVPLCLAGTCPQVTPPPPPPPPPPPTTLANQTLASPYFLSFNPTAVGKTITCTVTGSLTTNRPSLVVADFTGNVINLIGPLVTSRTTMGTFTSSSTGLVFLSGTDPTVPATTGSYSIVVTQAP